MLTMKKIIPPVERELLEKELTDDKFVRYTNNGNNKIYIFSNQDSPNLIREIGRLREITFRDAGGGTGEELDLDYFDISDHPFKQLIVWNPEDKEITGGYRFIQGRDTMHEGVVKSPTAKLFHFSDKFVKEYWPYTVELGRSFVQPNYQPAVNIRKGMYSLDNLWDGLGAIIIDCPEMKYFFGKITMYPHFDIYARDLILYFMQKFFPDPENLVRPVEPLPLHTSVQKLESVFTGSNYEENYKILVHQVREHNENIPPLVNAYMNLSSTMKTFGTAINREFGQVEETAIIVTIEDIYDSKKDRHVSTYRK